MKLSNYGDEFKNHYRNLQTSIGENKMILSKLNKIKQERRDFLFWFHRRVTSGSLLLTEKEAAWAGWCAAKGYIP